MKTAESFEGTVEVCCHSVAFRYWDFDHELTDELEAALAEEAESRACDCIVEGDHSGELNCLYDEEEFRGGVGNHLTLREQRMEWKPQPHREKLP